MCEEWTFVVRNRVGLVSKVLKCERIHLNPVNTEKLADLILIRNDGLQNIRG